jgi:hypothetical protein
MNDIRIALVYPGDADARQTATHDNNRFAPLFTALSTLGAQPEPAVYHPDFAEAVYQQLLQVDAVLVWVNPIQDGHDRTVLDALLKRVADAGTFVSAHPDVILKMGTKEVLYRTRGMGWGCDTHLYTTLEQLRDELPQRLASGETRVIKQNRGHSGLGVSRVQAVSDGMVKVRYAERGSVEQVIPLAEFYARCAPFFEGAGVVIDQAYQTRLPEGMIRCYLVHNQVAGFGHQEINALYPTPEGTAPADAPQPGPRLYFPPDRPDFQPLKHRLERDWLPELQALLDIPTEQLPVLWDADFLLGPKDAAGDDSYVLCEINVSSVSPYPDSATPVIAQAVLARAAAGKR